MTESKPVRDEDAVNKLKGSQGKVRKRKECKGRRVDIIVVGGGPAGMMAAISAKQHKKNAEVLLIEKNEKLGKKLFITGKGRGNLTNSCEEEQFFFHFLRNPRFIYPAFRVFSNRDLMDFMEKNGCPLKEERGGRIFPVSDKAYSLTDALKFALKKLGVKVECDRTLKTVKRKEDGFLCNIGGKDIFTKKLILATGGLSYPSTGSTGDGYRFAKEFSIPVTKLYPSLVKMEVLEEDIFSLSGLKLKHITATVEDEKGKVYGKKTGELYFQKDSVLGPTVLSLSAELSPMIHESPMGTFVLVIDLKGEMEDFDKTFLSECEKRGKESLKDLIQEKLPKQLFSSFCKRLEKEGVALGKKASESKKDERKKVLKLFHHFRFTIAATGSFKEAIVTIGGIDVKALSKKTMEAKSVAGLYFAGELIDADAYTGGYNMQIAFSTGYLAGKSAAEALTILQ